MYTLQLFFTISLLPYASPLFFDVKRYAAQKKDGNEPYKPINYFLNKQKIREMCLFMHCWNLQGHCKSTSNCCECRCKPGKTFFSDPHGCRDASELADMTKMLGSGNTIDSCLFATKKFGFDEIPLFDNPLKFREIELTLPRKNIPLDDSGNTCTVGAIFDHNVQGKKVLYNHNQCSEIFQVEATHKGLYLSLMTLNTTLWNGFRGRLLSLEIKCFSPRLHKMFSSCFMFQVEGKHIEDTDFASPAGIIADKPCDVRTLPEITDPITVPITTASTKKSTARKTTSLPTTTTKTPMTTTTTTTTATTAASTITDKTKAGITSTTRANTILASSSTKSATTKMPNDNDEKSETSKFTTVKNTSPTIIFVPANDSLTGTTIGILTGLGSGLAIVMICVIIWILIKKRKDIFSSTQQQQQQQQTSYNNPEGNPYYDVPRDKDRIASVRLSNNSTASYKIHFDKETPNGVERQYSSIDDTDMFVNQDQDENGSLLRGTGTKRSSALAKRPLPEKPLESGNPCYDSYINEPYLEGTNDALYDRILDPKES